MSDRDGDFEIFNMNVDGSDVAQLTFNDVYDHHPAWLAIPNKAPVVKEDSIQMVLNKSNIIDVLKNDSDEEALDAQYLSISSQPAHGSTKIVNGKIEYTPKKGFVGNDVLVYQICDSFLMDQKCAAGVMDILVKDIPSPPTISSVGSVALNGANKVYYTSNKPTFSGIAEPFATVKIEIHSDPIVLTTTADADGNWSVTPDQDIPNGEHTVKITTIKDGVESELITFVLGINVGLAETGVPLWPIGILGFMGFILSSMYVRKNLN